MAPPAKQRPRPKERRGEGVWDWLWDYLGELWATSAVPTAPGPNLVRPPYAYPYETYEAYNPYQAGPTLPRAGPTLARNDYGWNFNVGQPGAVNTLTGEPAAYQPAPYEYGEGAYYGTEPAPYEHVYPGPSGRGAPAPYEHNWNYMVNRPTGTLTGPTGTLAPYRPQPAGVPLRPPQQGGLPGLPAEAVARGWNYYDPMNQHTPEEWAAMSYWQRAGHLRQGAGWQGRGAYGRYMQPGTYGSTFQPLAPAPGGGYYQQNAATGAWEPVARTEQPWRYTGYLPPQFQTHTWEHPGQGAYGFWEPSGQWIETGGLQGKPSSATSAAYHGRRGSGKRSNLAEQFGEEERGEWVGRRGGKKGGGWKKGGGKNKGGGGTSQGSYLGGGMADMRIR